MYGDKVIVTENLSRRFGSIWAVKGVNLCVPAGVVYGFMGPNGAGKTTTIRMILGLIQPSAGSVALFGRPFERRQWQRLQRVGTLVESPSLYPHLTGRENLEVVRRMLDLPRQNIERALKIVELAKDGDRLARHYSLGMQQRLALALALLDDPLLLVLDEPTNGLDPSGIQEIRALIRDLPKNTGASVFLSSHLLSEVEQMATQVGIIHSGSLVYQGELAELKKRWGDVLRIKVDRQPEASALLTRLGYQVRQNGEGIEVSSADEASAARINQALMQNGFQVGQIYLHQPGLEEVFLEMTGPAAGERRA